MKKLLLLSALLLTLASQAQDYWTEYSTSQPATSTGIRSISIVDDNVVWLSNACGTTGCNPIRRYSRSTDSGVTWTTNAIDLGVNSNNLEIANISGVSATTAFAAVFPQAAGAIGGIWKTTDAGVSWTRQNTALFNGSSSFCSLVHFWDENNGVAVGDPEGGYYEIYTTNNSGTNWSRVPSATIGPLPIGVDDYSLTNNFTVTGNTIWFGNTYGIIYRSTDRGLTWTQWQSPIPDFGGGINSQDSADLAFTSETKGLLQTSDFQLFETLNGGQTWNQIFSNNGFSRNFGIAAIPGQPDHYISIGEDLDIVQRGSSFTTDGGLNWISINDNPDINYVVGGVIAMRNSEVGFASGFSNAASGGGIFKWNANGLLISNSNISIFAFVDLNSDGAKDASEPFYAQGTFSVQKNSNPTTFINSSNGTYLLSNISPFDTYNLNYSLPIGNLCLLSGSSYSNVSVALGSGTIAYAFPLVPSNQNCANLSVNLFPSLGSPRPSIVYSNRLTYQNTGNQTIASGTISFDKDPNATITNISQTGTVATANGFTYAFTNLAPYEERSFYISMILPAIPAVTIGQIVTNTASITPTDNNPNDNVTSLAQAIVASYDPNDKNEKHGGRIQHASFTNEDYLTYTIRFENTGNAEAFDVRIVDLLDVKLDETTIEMIDASHYYILERIGSDLTWNFANINLPPSVENTTIGKGYVVFRIKPKPGYAVGDIIPNTASIYFDTNPPIITNTFNTEFVENLAVNQFDNTDFAVYPNPTNGFINIDSKKTSVVIDAITLTDVLGKEIVNQKLKGSNLSIDLSQLSNGLYFLKIKSNGMEKAIKIMKD
jgi:uncharacterized repeat protein (TIGR01451 family)